MTDLPSSRSGVTYSVFGEPIIGKAIQPPLARFTGRHDRLSARFRVPPGASIRRSVEPRPRLDHPFACDGDAPINQIVIRDRTGHDENVLNAARLGHAGLVVTPSHTLKVPVSLERHDFAVWL